MIKKILITGPYEGNIKQDHTKGDNPFCVHEQC